MNKVYWVAIAVLLCIIIFQRECKSGPCPPTSVTIKADTQWMPGKVVHDTIPKPYPVEKLIQGKPYPVDHWDTVWLAAENQVIDSAAIVKDYFSTRHYVDTLHSDSSSVVINEKVNQNKLFDRQLTFNIRERQVTNTNAIPPRNQLYVGLDLGASAGFGAGGMQFTLKTKADNMYHFGVDYTTQNSFLFRLGMDWKIQLKIPHL